MTKSKNLIKENIESKDNYKYRLVKEKLKAREAMPVRGQFEGDTEAIKIKASRLAKGELKSKTESRLRPSPEY